ncbi:ATP dependent DNA ligase [Caballeronia calidae]|uniref:ATP dependent DNA ligase n=1 Tax=Caballeronia calidae TaxID=1777139 RepID=A0A158ENL7_9BURK|nr:ATP dependent DNA ligase [Caballeronia calidae]
MMVIRAPNNGKLCPHPDPPQVPPPDVLHHCGHQAERSPKTVKSRLQNWPKNRILEPVRIRDLPLLPLAPLRRPTPALLRRPVTGRTKLDIVRYYDAIAEWALPYLNARPLALVRAPDGIAMRIVFSEALGASAHSWRGRVARKRVSRTQAAAGRQYSRRTDRTRSNERRRDPLLEWRGARSGTPRSRHL